MIRLSINNNKMETNRDQLLTAAYLTCFLCEQRCLQPRMCPKCTKAFCSTCLLPFTTALRPDCPACAARLKPDDFLSPRVVMAIAEQVVENVKREIRRNEDRQVCSEHNLSMNYFCLDCNEALCSDCGMIGIKHKGHNFLAYRDIYERVKARVMEEFPRFDRKIKSLTIKKDKMKMTLNLLQSEYRRYKKLFEESFLNYTQKVDRQGKLIQDKLLSKQQSNAHRHNELQVLRDSIFDQMETKTHITLIKQASSLAESIEALACKESLPVFDEPSPELEQMVDLVPEFAFWNYTLTEFSTRNGIVYSEPQILNGADWRLKIYPRGNGLAKDKYISVFVQMKNGLLNQNKYQYRIQLLNPNHPQLSVKRQYCSSFEIGQCWGYNQFEPLDQLIAKQYLHEDSLTFKIGIRNHSYRSLVTEKALYINCLQNQIVKKQGKNEQRGMGREGMSEGEFSMERSVRFEKIKELLLQSKRSCEW